VKGYFYILGCADGHYYVGSTTNLDARVAEHRAGEGGDYTARRLPVAVVYSEEFKTLHDAFLVERQVKGWSRQKKEALIRRDLGALPTLARSRTAELGGRSILRQAQDANRGASLNIDATASSYADSRAPEDALAGLVREGDHA
jgi:putative endonuclease